MTYLGLCAGAWGLAVWCRHRLPAACRALIWPALAGWYVWLFAAAPYRWHRLLGDLASWLA